jgi:hypothetical protein
MRVRAEIGSARAGLSDFNISQLLDLIGGVSVTYIYASLDVLAYSSETGMMNNVEDGFFDASSMSDKVEELAEGDITIAYETFLNDVDDTSTRTRIYAAAGPTGTRTPMVTDADE